MDEQVYIDEDVPVRRYDYPDGSAVLVADLGQGRDGSVDVVDGTAIVVTGEDQYEVELPEDGTETSVRNGVLTIEVEG